MMLADPAVLVTTFLAGLLGSGHCFGMCGGIAGSLGALSGGGIGQRALIWAALQFNLGRLTGYACLGALAAGVMGMAGEISSFSAYGLWLRGITAMLVAVIGLNFLFSWRGLSFIEKGGAAIWRKIMPLATKTSQRHDWIGRALLGMCWGFLPCGLVYTVLITAASTGNAISGALTMFAFGAGTAPAMLGLTMAAPALSSFLSDAFVRKIVGFSLIILALWMIIPLLVAGQSVGHAHH